MGIKSGPKRIAKSTGKLDRRQRDNKDTPRNTPSLMPHKYKGGKILDIEKRLLKLEKSNLILEKRFQDFILSQLHSQGVDTTNIGNDSPF